MNRFWQGLLLAAIILVNGPAIVRGQESPVAGETSGEQELQTDRDSFTPATTTVTPLRSILESSYSFIDNRRAPEAHSFPETIIRRGITDRVELRVGWNYEAGGPTGAVSGVEFGDEDFIVEQSSDILYGFKVQLTEQRGWLPTSAVIAQGYTPTSGPATISRFTVADVFGWTLPNGWQWNSAIRFGTNNSGEDSFNQWAPSTVLKIPIGERWNVHAEYFGVVSGGKATPQSQHYGSVGGHVLLSEDLELGVRLGVGLNEQTAPFFSNVGLGWRF